MSVISVWYAVWFIFLTSPNDCRLFHIGDLIEFAWQISHSIKTPSTPRARKMQDRNAVKTCFHFHMLGYTMYIESRQENDLLQMFLLNKKPITRK